MSTEPGKHPGQTHLNSDAKIADEGRPQGRGGHPQGVPLPSFFGQETGLQLPKTYEICAHYRLHFSRRYALGRAPTRGAPTNCALCPRGAPTYCLLSALCPSIVFSRRYALGRAPTRGVPTNCLLSALCPGEGAHKGRPYLLSSLGVMPWGGHPQGAPLPIVFSRRYALGRAPTRGAPTYCLLSALCPGEGTHKGRPYLLSSLGVMPWGGHPQGAPLPIVFSPRYALGRAPTRGAPTRFRQPQVVLSQFDAIALGKHQGIGVSEKHLRSPHSGWLFCLVAN